MKLKAALSLLYFGPDCSDCLLVVVCGCEVCDVCEVCELVLVFRELLFHSQDFEDVPLIAMADMSFGKVEVCGGHRVHCEFVRLLLKGVTVFEFADDAVTRSDM